MHDAGALSWQQLVVLVDAFKAATSSSKMLVSEATELMLKMGATSQGLHFPWQASLHVAQLKPASALVQLAAALCNTTYCTLHGCLSIA